jgi:hypothetical protein
MRPNKWKQMKDDCYYAGRKYESEAAYKQQSQRLTLANMKRVVFQRIVKPAHDTIKPSVPQNKDFRTEASAVVPNSLMVRLVLLSPTKDLSERLIKG